MFCNANGCKWDCLDEDTFCAYCGLPLRRVDIHPPGLAFFREAGKKSSQNVHVRNVGLLPVRLRIGQSAPSRDWMEVSFPETVGKTSLLKCLASVEDGSFLEFPHQDAEVTLGVGAELKAVVQAPSSARYLDREMDGSLLFKGQGLTDERGVPAETFVIAVTHGPRPVAQIDAKDLVVLRQGSDRARVNFRIRSLREGFLTLTRAPEASVPWVTPRRWPQSPIAPGSESAASFDAGIDSVKAGEYTIRIRFTFNELAEPIDQEIRIRVVCPARVQPDKTFLNLGDLTAFSCAADSLVLENRGEDDLVLLGDPEISPVALRRNVRLLEDDPSHKKILSRSQGDPGKSFRVLVDTEGLALGDHAATLTFALNDPTRRVLKIQIAFTVRELKPSDRLLALDFGTSNCCIAAADGPYTFRPLDLKPAGATLPVHEVPTVFYFQSPGDYLVGEAAKNLLQSSPERTVPSIKRHLGEHQSFKLPGQSMAPREIARIILRHLWERAAASLGASPRDVLLTVPCNFGQAAIEDLKWATREAGFEPRTDEEFILDEPSAAAFHYVFSQRVSLQESGASHKILVYDFGGGTLDIALLEVAFGSDPKTRITVLEIDGVSIGGDDLDEALMQLFVERIRSLDPARWQTALDRVDLDRILKSVEGEADLELLTNRTRLRGVSEEVKRRLSDSPELDSEKHVVEFPVEWLRDRNGRAVFIGADKPEIKVSRQDFEDRIHSLLEQGNDIVRDVLERAQVPADDVDVLLLTGGTSQVPMVRRMVGKVCPKARVPTVEEVPPKLSVALGAVTYGNLKKYEMAGAAPQLVIEPLRKRVSFSIGTLDPLAEFVEILSRGALPLLGEHSMTMPPRTAHIHLVARQETGRLGAKGMRPIKEIGTVVIDPTTLSEFPPGTRVTIDFYFTPDRSLSANLGKKSLPIEFKTGFKGGIWL